MLKFQVNLNKYKTGKKKNLRIENYNLLCFKAVKNKFI